MSITQLRREVKAQLDGLAEDQLRSAADYVAFLGQKAKPAGLSDNQKKAKLRRAIREADAAQAAGTLVPLDRLRRRS